MPRRAAPRSLIALATWLDRCSPGELYSGSGMARTKVKRLFSTRYIQANSKPEASIVARMTRILGHHVSHTTAGPILTGFHHEVGGSNLAGSDLSAHVALRRVTQGGQKSYKARNWCSMSLDMICILPIVGWNDKKLVLLTMTPCLRLDATWDLAASPRCRKEYN
jgi:hypothetical protein